MNNLIKTAIIAIFTLFITIKNSDANMFNKFKDGFYFEKYSSADEAKAALLELHPIGSDVEGLIKTLEMAGGNVYISNMSNYKKFYQEKYLDWQNKGNVVAYDIKYDKASPFFVILNWLEWNGTVWVDRENKITFIHFNRGRAY